MMKAAGDKSTSPRRADRQALLKSVKHPYITGQALAPEATGGEATGGEATGGEAPAGAAPAGQEAATGRQSCSDAGADSASD